MPKTMTVQGPQTQSTRKAPLVQERKYKCAYCARAFSRSEHRSRHERSRMLFISIGSAYFLGSNIAVKKIRKRDLSNALNVEAHLLDEIYYYDMTVQYMQKMEVFRYTVR